MPRYEYEDGKSAKFWEIELDGSSFTTTWGKLGTAGQSKTKSFADEARARAEHDKLIAQKTKKGYVLVGGKKAKAKASAKKASAKKASAKKASARKKKTSTKPAAEVTEPGFTRYELVQGSTSKFWEVGVHGSELTTRYGRIGSAGQSKTKSFASAAAAQAERDKLVAQKTKKGYALADGALGAKRVESLVGLEDEDEIRSHVKAFVFRKIVDFKGPEFGLQSAKKGVAYRIATNWDRGGAFFEESLRAVLADERVGELEALVIGMWGDGGTSSQGTIDALVEAKAKLTGLRALFLGDIHWEENEVSWIQQGDWSKLLQLPALEHLRVRGGSWAKLGPLKSETLRSLTLQSGGLSRSVVQAVMTSALPNLEHLELWLGTSNYGGETRVEDLMPLLSGKLFPKLRYLGLRNAEIANDCAREIASAPILSQLDTVDLSLGSLDDVGGEALLASPGIQRLQKLNCHRNWFTKDVVKKLKALGIPKLDVSDGDVRSRLDWIEEEIEAGEPPEIRYAYTAVGE